MPDLKRRLERLEQTRTTPTWAVVTDCPHCGERVRLNTETPCGSHPPITADHFIVVDFVDESPEATAPCPT